MAAHGEWVGNYGYIAFSTETTAGTPAATPSVFALLTDETMSTLPNHEDEVPIAGLANNTYQVVKGIRSHKGDFTFVAEPNTAMQAFDMVLPRLNLGMVLYQFTITSASPGMGSVYTNNSQTFYIAQAATSATTIFAWGTGAPLASGTLTYVSGAPTGNLTYSAEVTVANYFNTSFGLSTSVLPKSKTVDISTGNVVKRFTGVQGSKIAMSQQGAQIFFKVSASGLNSFQGGVVASVSGTGPSTVTFDTTYDSNPGSLLLTGDLMRSYHPATGATIDFTLTGSTATTVTTATNLSTLVAGDIIFLRPQTVSLSLQSPHVWGGTQFMFGTSAQVALNNAQTRLEQSSMWEIDYNFENDNGSPRSGDYDPASLVHTLGKSHFHLKKFFDTPEQVIDFNQMNKTAVVTRHFSGFQAVSPLQTYEVRVTQNHLVTSDPLPKIKSDGVNFTEMDYFTQYDTTDAQEFNVNVISSLSTIT